jgi:hypothetical protein
MKTPPGKDARRTVHAFIGVLACSRLPFIQFVWGQSQSSFIASIIAMFTFWGGVTKRLNLDNLKAGVIKADIHDPVLNRSLSEAADHYHFFIDPCRVASPTEKGKVERMVQTAREVYRQLSALYPEESLEKLSLRAQDWCRDVYGATVHGTIGVPPLQAFTELEKPALQPLPESPFKLTQWGSAKVHPDQYIRFQGRFYSLPARYIGQTVQVRRDGKMIDIFFQEPVIRSYTIPSGHRAYLSADFPETTRGMMDGSYASYLIRKGEAQLGADVATLLKQVLDVPANQNARRALGILDRLNKHKGGWGNVSLIGCGRVSMEDQSQACHKQSSYKHKHRTDPTISPRERAPVFPDFTPLHSLRTPLNVPSMGLYLSVWGCSSWPPSPPGRPDAGPYSQGGALKCRLLRTSPPVPG